jgi:heterodisulfide reductase subunit B
MQSYLYFPGCTLRTVAKDFDSSAKACARALGFELKEMQGWLCCGAVYTNVPDNLMTQSGPNRILARARTEGDTLVTLCAGCYNVLKRTGLHAKSNSTRQEQINSFNEETFAGNVSVLHFLEILRDRVRFDAIKASVKKPLQGLPVGAYYGCLLLRPSAEMRLDDPHRPSILENLLASIGCTPVDYPLRTECCGSYLTVDSAENVEALSQNIAQSARSSGAKVLAVSCPLCKYNLDLAQSRDPEPIPIVYFTQLLGLALGAEAEQLELTERQLEAIRGDAQTVVASVNQQ